MLAAAVSDNTVAWYEHACTTSAPTMTLAPTSSAPTPRPTVQCGAVSFSEHVVSTKVDNARAADVADLDGDADLDVRSSVEATARRASR